MYCLFSSNPDAVGCVGRELMGVCSLFQKTGNDKSLVDYSAKCALLYAPGSTIPIDIHHRHAPTCDLHIRNPAWFRDSTDLFFHFFLSQPGRKACFYPPPPGLFFYGAPTRARASKSQPAKQKTTRQVLRCVHSAGQNWSQSPIENGTCT